MSIDYEVRNRIAYIAFCRPEKHNALRDEDIADLIEAIEKLDDDERADIGIIHGRGRSFSSGADVAERLQRSIEEQGSRNRTSEFDSILSSKSCKPLIAAVHGYCLGHALGTALLCDLLVAEQCTKFRAPETALGIPLPGLWFQLGHNSFASDVTMTSRYFTGEEAARMGLVTRLVDDGTHLACAEEIANSILENPQGAVRELVRVRRTAVANMLREARSIAGEFDWARSVESADRIGEMVSRVTGSVGPSQPDESK